MSFADFKTNAVRFWQRFQRSRKRRGVLGTVRAGLNYGRYLVTFRLRERRFDRELGVNTRGTEGRHKARILSGIRDAARDTVTGFGPSDPPIIVDLLDALPLRYEDFAFVDIGAGSGRVILIASDRPFRKVLGVELSPELAAVGSRNVRNRRRPAVCRDVESVAGDATAHPIPDGPVLLFLHNPFTDAAPMERLLANVERSWKASPRPIYILYVNPTQRAVFEKFPLFRELPALREYARFYRTPDSSPAS